MRCFDTQMLRFKGRNLSPPFQLVLDAEPSCRNLTCTAILRHLPGKRLVCAGHHNDHTPCVAKIFLAPSGAERHYQRELRGIKAMQRARIPTPELLFEGKLAEGHAPVLLFRQMTAYEDLTKRLAKTDKPEECLGALRLVVKAIARLHAAGLKQRDIHPGNFLLSANAVLIIDGDDIESAGPAPLPERESLSNLALFFAQFFPSFDDFLPDLVTLYAESRNWNGINQLPSRVHSETQRWRRWRLKKFLLKTQRSCTAFHAQKSWRRFVVWDRKWYSPIWKPLIENPDRLIERGTILKAGNSATVAKVTIGGQTVVIKRYNIKNIIHALRRAPRSSRAMMSWRNAHRLRFLGIATPQPLALIEERWGPFRKCAYLVMSYLPGQTVEREIRENLDNPKALDVYTEKLSLLLEQLAVARITHGDLKATNFIVVDEELYLLDLDSMRNHRQTATFKRAFHKDMARLERNWDDLPHVRKGLAARPNSPIEADWSRK
jgi:tRNA A-37 threonylcarbamoyl transferase component Bud32